MTATEETLTSAVDHVFLDAGGNEVRLSDLWSGSERGIVLVFLRHFGCLFCREHASQLRDMYPEFTRRGFDIVAIGQGTPMRSQRFREDYRLPFVVLGDKELVSYRDYGLTHGIGNGITSPGAYKAFFRALGSGHVPGKPDGDSLQNPGTFLIDRNGIILYQHVGTNAGDFPTAREILDWIDAVPDYGVTN